MVTRFKILLILLVFVTSSHAALRESQLLDRIVALVDEDVVLLSELLTEEQAMRKLLAANNAPAMPADELRQQALERVLIRKLQLVEATKLGITVDEETLLKSIGTIAERNNLSIAELEKALVAEGMSIEVYREDLREQIILGRLKNREVLARIQITKAEVDNYLANAEKLPGGRSAFRLRHILISIPEGGSSEELYQVKAETERLIDQLRKGASFAAMATRYSAGRQALEGGDLGWIESGKLPGLFTTELAVMERGEIAGPIQSASGFHIVKLEDYRGGDRSIIKQTHARHILVRTDELTSDDAARTRLRQLHTRITGGEDFAALARANSQDTVSAIKGGDLGWVSPGSLVPKFEEVMDSLAINAVSEPFRSQFGWHIIQVLERRDHDATDDVRRESARTALRDQKAEEAQTLYVRKLRDQAYVEVLPAE
jgi:peptidyl-prolyl cis-trans isomerase SurA